MLLSHSRTLKMPKSTGKSITSVSIIQLNIWLMELSMTWRCRFLELIIMTGLLYVLERLQFQYSFRLTRPVQIHSLIGKQMLPREVMCTLILTEFFQKRLQQQTTYMVTTELTRCLTVVMSVGMQLRRLSKWLKPSMTTSYMNKTRLMLVKLALVAPNIRQCTSGMEHSHRLQRLRKPLPHRQPAICEVKLAPHHQMNVFEQILN